MKKDAVTLHHPFYDVIVDVFWLISMNQSFFEALFDGCCCNSTMGLPFRHCSADVPPSAKRMLHSAQEKEFHFLIGVEVQNIVKSF